MEISWENKWLFSILQEVENKMKKAIYKITNRINNKIYIGQSLKPEERFLQHCHKRENYVSLINQAIQKYGKENFNFEILGWFEDYNQKEIYYIECYGSRVPNGYNLTIGGENPPIGAGKTIDEITAFSIQKDLLNWKIPRRQITKKYKVTENIMRHINDGNSWRNNTYEYPLRPTEHELNENRASQVIEMLLHTTLTQKEIGKKVGWNRSAVTMINNGKNHYRENIEYPIRK